MSVAVHRSMGQRPNPGPPRRAGLVPAIVASVLMCALHAHALDDGATRALLQQRIRLIATLIADSPAAARITSSGNATAVAHLDEGRVHHALAQDLFESGDIAGASREVDEALRHVSMARRMVPDTSARLAAARLRNEQLLASTERLIGAWRDRTPMGDAGAAGDLLQATSLLDVARRLAAAGHFGDADQALGQAERHVLSGMARSLPGATLDYTLRFSTPAEEFQHELARQRDLADLLPVAIRELKPRADALALIERYGETGKALQLQALQQYQAGQTAQAMVHLRNATMYLQRALLAAGLVAPPPTGATP